MPDPLLAQALLRCAARRGWITDSLASDLVERLANADAIAVADALRAIGAVPAAQQLPTLLPPPSLPRFGRWTALARLGGGAMGAVWLASDGSGPLAVVKTAASAARAPLGGDPGGSVWQGGGVGVPRPSGESELITRFAREARITASLANRRVVPCLDGGVAEDGTRYLVLAWVPAGDLSARLKRDGPLPPACALAIADQLAEALDHAHARGVIHRDVKAANIFAHDDGSILLGDFGLARPTGIGATRLTMAGVAVGTPNGMAPEQIDGRDSLDGRADLYGLGCLLCECLTGHAPFAGRSAEVMHAHRTAEPPDLDSLVPGLPPGTAELVRSLLAKRPEDRPADAAALRAQLAPLLLACGVQPGVAVPFARAERLDLGDAIVLDGGEHAVVAWAKKCIILGKMRGPGTDLVVRDYPEDVHRARLGRISRRHAAIQHATDGSWTITDLSSANGTTINGEALTAQKPRRLTDLDRVSLAGVCELTARITAGGLVLHRPENRPGLAYAVVARETPVTLEGGGTLPLGRDPQGWTLGGRPLRSSAEVAGRRFAVRPLGDWL